jgi:hypothetical protein
VCLQSGLAFLVSGLTTLRGKGKVRRSSALVASALDMTCNKFPNGSSNKTYFLVQKDEILRDYF